MENRTIDPEYSPEYSKRKNKPIRAFEVVFTGCWQATTLELHKRTQIIERIQAIFFDASRKTKPISGEHWRRRTRLAFWQKQSQIIKQNSGLIP